MEHAGIEEVLANLAAVEEALLKSKTEDWAALLEERGRLIAWTLQALRAPASVQAGPSEPIALRLSRSAENGRRLTAALIQRRQELQTALASLNDGRALAAFAPHRSSRHALEAFG